jgi:3-methyladenine DNA glycosylase AlkD
MKTAANKRATKSAKTSSSKIGPKPATKQPKSTTKPFATKASLQDEVQSALKWLKSHSTKATLDGMARYALPSNNALGVAYRDMKVLGKRLGRNHELAAALWDTGVYEARMVTSFIADTAFALLWSLSVHDKHTGDEPFVQGLALIERAAGDERNFVKKSVNMALRAIGKRNRALNAAAIAVARRLVDSPNSVARWVGKDALRELTSPSVIRRLKPRPNSG